jgi:predicted nucleic acid-binding protein
MALKSKELADLLAAIDREPVSEAVIALARASFPVNVRAIDALHVATAQVLRDRSQDTLEFWTHDGRQARAALARGLAVLGDPQG